MRRILMRRILMRRILMRPIHYPVFVTKRLIFDHESHEWSNFTNIFQFFGISHGRSEGFVAKN